MKVLKILILFICLTVILSQNIFAMQEIFETGEDWMNTGKSNAGYGIDTSLLQEKSKTIYYLFLSAGTIVAVIVGAILGIKFMLAGTQEKAEVKETLLPYLISCAVLFGGLGIWKLIISISSSFV